MRIKVGGNPKEKALTNSKLQTVSLSPLTKWGPLDKCGLYWRFTNTNEIAWHFLVLSKVLNGLYGHYGPTHMETMFEFRIVLSC